MSREMKHSGIEWIGDIPKEWKVARLKDIKKNIPYAIVDGPFGSAISTNDYQEHGVPLVRIVNLTGKYVDSTSTMYISPELATTISRSSFHLYDILFAKTGATVGKCSINDSIEYGILSSSCVKISIAENLYFVYYYFYFCTKQFNLALKLACGGSTRDTINLVPFKNLPCLIPPLPEQQKIADYLDKVCGEIDGLVALQEAMIDELKAYKQSVITEAVTRGLNPNVPLKPSGIDWIGDIPKEWDVCRIKNVASLFGRIGFRGYSSDDLNKEGIGAITLSPSNMKPMEMDYANVTFLSWRKYQESPEIQIQNGDLLMVKTGSSYGKVSFVDNLPREATINPQILRIVPSISSKYLGYYMQTSMFSFQVEGGIVGGTIPTISQEKINNFFVVLPSAKEQIIIASYLDTKCSEIDSLIAIKQQKIEELKAYKKSVIYEYVTGKKEVV